MKKIIINISVFIIVLFSCFTLLQSLQFRAMNAELNACGENSETGNCYMSGKVSGDCVVYKVSEAGRVINVYEEKFRGAAENLTDGEIVDLCYKDDIFYLAKARNKLGNDYYKLVRLSEDMKQVATVISSDFEDDISASKMNIVGNVIYLTMLTANHKEAYTYAMELDAKEKEWYLLSRQECSSNRYFIEALYTGVVLQAGLDNGTYVFYESEEEKVLADENNLLLQRQNTLEAHPVSMSSLQILLRVADQVVIQNFILAIFFILLAIIFYLLFTSHYYAMKQFAMLELAMFVFITAAILFYMQLNSRNMQKNYMENVQICFDFFDEEFSGDNAYFLDARDYYNSEDYAGAYDELAEFSRKTGFVKQLMLVDVDGDTEQVMASLNSYRTTAGADYLSIRMEEMIKEARESATAVYEAQAVRGDTYGVYVIPLRDKAVIRKFIVAIVSLDTANRQSNQFRTFLLLMGVLSLALATAGCAIFVRYMTRDIREFSKAMLANTEETVRSRKPSVNNNEVEFMWNALAEMTKRYEKVNYSKYLVLQAYYRFAPRKIETILGKESIIDVEIGDMVQIDGTMAMVAFRSKREFDDRNYVDSVTRDFEILGQFQAEEGGVIISKNNSLTYLKMLFMEKAEKALHFGINTIHAYAQTEEKENAFVLLHSARFLYGVSGNSEQTFPFTVSAEIESLDKYVKLFQKMDAGMIITETVELTEEIRRGCRYIGYLELTELQENLKLYQVLDAYAVRKRNRFLATEEQFQEGLQSFYKRDFYIARNSFTDVLKSNTEDEIARWYLFACEKYLNDFGRTEFSFGIFSE